MYFMCGMMCVRFVHNVPRINISGLFLSGAAEFRLLSNTALRCIRRASHPHFHQSVALLQLPINERVCSDIPPDVVVFDLIKLRVDLFRENVHKLIDIRPHYYFC